MKKILVRELEIGNYKSKTWWYKTDDGVWVDNSFHTIVKDIGNNVVREIDNRRNVPKKSMPPICVHCPSDSITTSPILIDIDNNFWRFKTPIDHAITVWLSFDNQGKWKIIDVVTGEVIGDSISYPMLSKNDEGFSWSGPYDGQDDHVGDRQNADMWFKQWSIHATTTIGLATVAEITSNISDASNNLYYAVAHGGSTQAMAGDAYLNASDVVTAMESRDPMWFAFFGHCDAMTDTGSGTFSYAFRKGSTTNTWTVGFTNMGSCPSYSDASAWQNEMFAHIHSGKTFKDAFDLATATYSGLDGYVAYVGDPTIGIITRKIQLKRGLDADRTSFTPVDGEPIWCTDTKKLYIGDGTTAGGIFIGP